MENTKMETTKQEEKKIGFTDKIKNFKETHPKTVAVAKRVAIAVAIGAAVAFGRKYITENGAEIMEKIGTGNDQADPSVVTDNKE